MKKILKGRGITAKQVVELEPEEWGPIFEAGDHLAERLGRPPDVFDWQAAALEEWAEEKLTGNKGQPEPDSPADFAIRMLQAAARARDSIERGRPAEAAIHALTLGELKSAVSIKWPWEKFALRDQRRQAGCAEGGRKGGATNREKALDPDEIVKKAQEMLAAKHDRREIAGKLAKLKGVTARRIRQILKERGF